MGYETGDFRAWFGSTNSKKTTQTIYDAEGEDHEYPFAFTVNFADIAKPQTNTVTIYNMSKEHRNFYKKKQKCTLYANYGPDKKMLAEGYISKIDVAQSDGVTTSQVISFVEGTDYSNVSARKLRVKKTRKSKRAKTVRKTVKGKKRKVRTRSTRTVYVNRTYRKGTRYKTIIKGIASKAKIKIAKLDLAKDPKIKKAYTARGKPLTLLKQLVKKTGSQITYVRGKLEIINPKSPRRSWIDVDDQILTQPPTYNTDDDGEGTWEITTPLIPDVTTNVGIHMDSKYLKGYYYVKSGQHVFDGENPQTQCSLAKA